MSTYAFDSSAMKGKGTVTVLCPFHEEKTPSCVIDVAKGTWHCFGGCEAHGKAEVRVTIHGSGD